MHTGSRLIAAAAAALVATYGLALAAPPGGAAPGGGPWVPPDSGGSTQGGGFSAWSYWAAVDDDGNASELTPCDLSTSYDMSGAAPSSDGSFLPPGTKGHVEYVLYTFGDRTGSVWQDCIADNGPHITPDSFPPIWQPMASWPVTLGDPQELIRQALAVIYPTPPGIGSSPSADAPRQPMVGISTWFWLEGGAVPAEQTITDGPLAVTVRATPESISWHPGDAGAVTCRDGTGVGQAGTDTCSYTYSHSSAGQPGNAYTVTASVSYTGSYTVTFNGQFVGGSPNIGGATRDSTLALPVTDGQAINTRR